MGEQGGVNLYAFCNNNPVENVDFGGLWGKVECTPRTPPIMLGQWELVKLGRKGKEGMLGSVSAIQDLIVATFRRKEMRLFQCQCPCSSEVIIKQITKVHEVDVPLDSGDDYPWITWSSTLNTPETFIPINSNGIKGYVGEVLATFVQGPEFPVDANFKVLLSRIKGVMRTGLDSKVKHIDEVPTIFCY